MGVGRPTHCHSPTQPPRTCAAGTDSGGTAGGRAHPSTAPDTAHATYRRRFYASTTIPPSRRLVSTGTIACTSLISDWWRCWFSFLTRSQSCVECRCPETRPYLRGYIAMLAVATSHRRSGTGTALAARAMEAMVVAGAAEAVLEAEACNVRALGLYENLGFMRTKRLEGYYLNGSDAFRLVARLPRPAGEDSAPP